MELTSLGFPPRAAQSMNSTRVAGITSRLIKCDGVKTKMAILQTNRSARLSWLQLAAPAALVDTSPLPIHPPSTLLTPSLLFSIATLVLCAFSCAHATFSSLFSLRAFSSPLSAARFSRVALSHASIPAPCPPADPSAFFAARLNSFFFLVLFLDSPFLRLFSP